VVNGAGEGAAAPSPARPETLTTTGVQGEVPDLPTSGETENEPVVAADDRRGRRLLAAVRSEP